MTNRHTAAVVLQSLNVQQQVLTNSIGEIAAFLELAYREARDLTAKEMEVVLSMIIERQPKVQDNVMRSIIYRAE
jgi:hypothetical protein